MQYRDKAGVRQRESTGTEDWMRIPGHVNNDSGGM
jgi:hypothetical protein